VVGGGHRVGLGSCFGIGPGERTAPAPTVLVMMDHHNLDIALLRWLEAKLATSDPDTYHEDALNYLVGLVLSDADSPDAETLAPVR